MSYHGNKRNLNGTPKRIQVEIICALGWLEIVSSTYILMSRYNHSLSLDATIMISKYCPTIDERIVSIFVTQ